MFLVSPILLRNEDGDECDESDSDEWEIDDEEIHCKDNEKFVDFINSKMKYEICISFFTGNDERLDFLDEREE